MSDSVADDVWDLDQDDLESERAIAAQSLGKIEKAFSNAGYKYGIDAGKIDHMQEGFDAGFELSIQQGKMVGSLLGALMAQREIRRRLNLPAENIDSLVMRLRAMKHKAAIKSEFLMGTGSGDQAKEAAEQFGALVKEASDTLEKLTIQ
ncbi:hypothetical protein GQ54DRAFT_266008 [Martensiomyces pterosporus]|nr:hypothetical protein GQ54DRAFT_266008 [Martensiomyces pterosporus]